METGASSHDHVPSSLDETIRAVRASLKEVRGLLREEHIARQGETPTLTRVGLVDPETVFWLGTAGDGGLHFDEAVGPLDMGELGRVRVGPDADHPAPGKLVEAKLIFTPDHGAVGLCLLGSHGQLCFVNDFDELLVAESLECLGRSGLGEYRFG